MDDEECRQELLDRVEALQDEIADLKWNIERLEDDQEDEEAEEVGLYHNLKSCIDDDRHSIMADKAFNKVSHETADFCLEVLEKYSRDY